MMTVMPPNPLTNQQKTAVVMAMLLQKHLPPHQHHPVLPHLLLHPKIFRQKMLKNWILKSKPKKS